MSKSKNKKKSVDPEVFEDLPMVEKIRNKPKEREDKPTVNLNNGGNHNKATQEFLKSVGLI